MKEFVSLIAAEAGDLRYYINFLHYNNIYNYYHSIFRMSPQKKRTLLCVKSSFKLFVTPAGFKPATF